MVEPMSKGFYFESYSMTPELELCISKIDDRKDEHLQLIKKMLEADGGNLFPLDLLATAVLKRSMSLCAGFTALVRTGNYTSAASLLRLQLDSCLRFYAAFIVEKPHEFAENVLAGTAVRKCLCARAGVLM